jgi:hypothetical protein
VAVLHGVAMALRGVVCVAACWLSGWLRMVLGALVMACLATLLQTSLWIMFYLRLRVGLTIDLISLSSAELAMPGSETSDPDPSPLHSYAWSHCIT